MRQRLMASALAALFGWGCGEDSTRVVDPGFDPGPSAAGSCNFVMAQGTCDEYAEAKAAQAAQNCASAGGTWTSGKCPFIGRLGLCTATNPASRTYAYTMAAATSLQGSCPAANFVMYDPPAAGRGGSGGRSGAGGAGSGGTSGSGGVMGTAGTDDDAGM